MNSLGKETSPYLLQHATNPVDWHVWGDDAFAAAKAQNKPVFLSIGYSTCHWCHVMAHESFENPDIAALMNKTFINVKVDREERPDIDAVYMAVCQAITGGGGWPLTIVMTPDKEPFFAGTYFPPERRHGRSGMRELIARIDSLWKTKRDELLRSAAQVTQLMRNFAPAASESPLGIALLSTALDEFKSDYDPDYGGFGPAPKFPTPQKLIYLLRCRQRFNDDQALEMVEATLQAMRNGGIYDHVGFGFHRYATDASWLLPHFEKMLYDQAMIAIAYLEAYQVTRNPAYAETVHEIFSYVLRELLAPQGAFYGAQDADSEGEEGRFYVWTKDEVEQALTRTEAAVWNRVYAVEKGGNYHDEATRQKTGANIFHLKQNLGRHAAELKMTQSGLVAMLERCRKKLFAAREKRVYPLRDDKILTDINGLMIAAYALGGRILDDDRYTAAARSAADYILNEMLDDQGRLLHCRRNAADAVSGFLDDYAFFIWGLIELYQSCFETGYLESAIALNNHLLRHYWDEQSGGFFFTSDDHEALLFRKKTIHDGAIPSGNSVAALNLLRLARMTGHVELEQKAELVGNVFAGLINRSPASASFYLLTLDHLLGPAYEIVIVGKRDRRNIETINRPLSRRFLPNKVVLFVPDDQDAATIRKIAPFAASFKAEPGKTLIYVCTDRSCQKPTTDIAEMMRLLTEV